MANEEHLAILQQGVEAWNRWRKSNPSMRPDLSRAELFKAKLPRANLMVADLRGAYLSETNLNGANLTEANLSGATLTDADFREADLVKANLTGADLSRANLGGADLTMAILRRVRSNEAHLSATNFSKADISNADLMNVDLRMANLSEVDLRITDLTGADLWGASLYKANLSGANLREANLSDVVLNGADLSGANLSRSMLIGTLCVNTILSGCRIYGVSAWSVNLDGAIQSDLIISNDDDGEAEITVDNLEVAQFVYMLLHNEKIRDVIDTLTTKSVLILGRFTEERKPVLEAIKNELRKRNYVPILFDFEKPTSRDLTETVVTLAHLSRFAIADLTSPSSLPAELMSFVRDLPSVPVQPIILKEHRSYAMFEHLERYHWVLPTHEYTSQAQLIAELPERVIEPAERKVAELRPKLL